ncbi:hypothetical protein T265_05846 [Opisthorchis viverrini]|uniref:Uncharacterized protein n=1 Tax=Opisthorchis viverrini TaxID=6198 RepID=A0A074ZI66_OPIVI|nr:hypothetical protein T265_05846 [Opisthorchis viverrini]KER27013.1 hypothetical protein T265_05846 [Opisthorchis viverrini]
MTIAWNSRADSRSLSSIAVFPGFMSDDFLEQIVLGEEITYQETYKDVIMDSASVADASGVGADDFADSPSFSTRDNDEAERRQMRNAWQLGLHHGARLASELCCYYGIADELLSSNRTLPEDTPQSIGASVSPYDKRESAISKVARELHFLLTVQPGLLSVDGEKPVALNFSQDVFDHNVTLIRNKARHLNSLLDLRAVEQTISNLSF